MPASDALYLAKIKHDMFSSSGSETSIPATSALLTTGVHAIFIITFTKHHSSFNHCLNQLANSLPIN
jgi:hypothetical protein